GPPYPGIEQECNHSAFDVITDAGIGGVLVPAIELDPGFQRRGLQRLDQPARRGLKPFNVARALVGVGAGAGRIAGQVLLNSTQPRAADQETVVIAGDPLRDPEAGRVDLVLVVEW